MANKATIEAIAQVLNNLNSANLNEASSASATTNFIHIHKKDSYKNSKPFIYLTISKLDYILNVFIPFFDNLIFLSKKKIRLY